MNESLMQVGKKMRAVGVLSGIGLAFAYLTFLSIGSIVLVVALLTAHQFQHAIKTAELGGKPVALWQVVELRENWRVLQVSGAASTRALEDAQQGLSRQERSLRDLEEALGNAESDSNALDITLHSKLVEFGTSNANIESAIKISPFRFRGAAYRELAKGVKYPDDQAKVDFEKLLQKFDTEMSASFVIDSQITTLRHQVDEARVAVKKLETDASNAGAGFEELLKLKDGDDGSKQLLGNFLSQLNALDATWFGLLGSFATMAPDFLTLLLVLAMGVLGGTLHLARLYIEGAANSVGYFLYRPFLGAIAALVIFVVARTGVFVVADPGNQSGSAPLSPFFISFVAIVSGMLAEQAIDSIQGIGSKWFAGPIQDLAERYSLRVAEETAKQKKDKTQLQNSGELEEEEFQSLFDGKKKVSAQTQRIAAVWLGKPIRELFTDIPPPEQKK